MKGTQHPARIIGYVRVSTEDQKLGPEAQAEAIRSWCERHDAELVAMFSDLGVSGGAPLEKRVELLKAIDALKEHNADGLLVAKRDRIARDVMIAAMIERLVERAGAKVISADGTGNGDTPEAQLMRNMISAFADYERALIRARTKAALAVKKSRGERTGQIPYGFRLAVDGVSLKADLDEQAVIEDVMELRAKGLTYKMISEELERRGIPARGEKWHITSVRRIVVREAIHPGE